MEVLSFQSIDHKVSQEEMFRENYMCQACNVKPERLIASNSHSFPPCPLLCSTENPLTSRALAVLQNSRRVGRRSSPLCKSNINCWSGERDCMYRAQAAAVTAGSGAPSKHTATWRPTQVSPWWSYPGATLRKRKKTLLFWCRKRCTTSLSLFPNSSVKQTHKLFVKGRAREGAVYIVCTQMNARLSTSCGPGKDNKKKKKGMIREAGEHFSVCSKSKGDLSVSLFFHSYVGIYRCSLIVLPNDIILFDWSLFLFTLCICEWQADAGTACRPARRGGSSPHFGAPRWTAAHDQDSGTSRVGKLIYPTRAKPLWCSVSLRRNWTAWFVHKETGG